MTNKIYYLNSYHRGRNTIIKGTVEQLRKYFSYTLECGHSWNNKISMHPTTYKGLISAINKSYYETQGSCYDPDYVMEATENDYTNADNLGYRTSEAGNY